jgi:hypothetical protein
VRPLPATGRFLAFAFEFAMAAQYPDLLSLARDGRGYAGICELVFG